MSSSIVVYNKFSFNNLVNSLGVIMKNFLNSFGNVVLNVFVGVLCLATVASALLVQAKNVQEYNELVQITNNLAMQKSLMEVELEALRVKNSILTNKNASLQSTIDDSILLPTPRVVAKGIETNVVEPAKLIAVAAGSNIADYSVKSYDTVKNSINRFVEYVKQ